MSFFSKIASYTCTISSLALLFYWCFYFNQKPLGTLLFLAISFIIGALISNYIKVKYSDLLNLIISFVSLWIFHLKEISPYFTVVLILLAFVFGLLTSNAFRSLYRIPIPFILAVLFALLIAYFVPKVIYIFYLIALCTLPALLFHNGLSRKLIGTFILITLFGFAEYKKSTIPNFDNQYLYKDLVVFSQKKSDEVQITTTRWKGNLFLYYNGRKYLTDYDLPMFTEPPVLMALGFVPNAQNILVIGNESASFLPVILENAKNARITFCPLIPDLHSILKDRFFISLHAKEINNDRVTVIENVKQAKNRYDVILCDFSFTKQSERSMLDSYMDQLSALLTNRGVLVTPLSDDDSPFILTNLPFDVNNSAELKINVITLGEIKWKLTSPDPLLLTQNNFDQIEFDRYTSLWFNQSAARTVFHLPRKKE